MTWNDIKNEVKSVGIIFDAGGLGDRLQFSSIPENFYRNTGLKLCVPCFIDVFARNPFIVVTNLQPDLVLDPWFGFIHFTKKNESFKISFPTLHRSLAEKHKFFNDFKLYLNRPRLYAFENLPAQPDLILIHRTGRTVGELSDDVVNFVVEKYKHKGYRIGQIGGKEDKEILGVLDYRGRDLFETAELMGQAAVFIGLNSGMYHLASCYNVQKKVILNEYWNEEQLEMFFPLSFAIDPTGLPDEKYPKNSVWLDFNAEYYNLSNHDVGITRSIYTI